MTKAQYKAGADKIVAKLKPQLTKAKNGRLAVARAAALSLELEQWLCQPVEDRDVADASMCGEAEKLAGQITATCYKHSQGAVADEVNEDHEELKGELADIETVLNRVVPPSSS